MIQLRSLGAELLDQKQIETLTRYWRSGADDDLDAAKDVLTGTKRYATALFHMHLAVEKLLKYKVVELTGDYPPYTHNLVHLLSKLNWEVEEARIDFLAELSQFNLSTRYPNVKDAIRAFATKELAESFLLKTEEVFQWILSK